MPPKVCRIILHSCAACPQLLPGCLNALFGCIFTSNQIYPRLSFSKKRASWLQSKGGHRHGNFCCSWFPGLCPPPPPLQPATVSMHLEISGLVLRQCSVMILVAGCCVLPRQTGYSNLALHIGWMSKLRWSSQMQVPMNSEGRNLWVT